MKWSQTSRINLKMVHLVHSIDVSPGSDEKACGVDVGGVL